MKYKQQQALRAVIEKLIECEAGIKQISGADNILEMEKTAPEIANEYKKIGDARFMLSDLYFGAKK